MIMKTILACIFYVLFMALFIAYLIKTASGSISEYPDQTLKKVPKVYHNFLVFVMIMGAIGCLLIIVFYNRDGHQ